MSRELIVYQPPPLLTIEEMVLFKAARNDFAFQAELLQRAIIRSLGIPTRLLVGDTRYSSTVAEGELR